MDIWAWIAWFFWIFVFVSCLMVVFSIIGDIFRDDSMNGWVKALWIILLVFLPLLTALVYLIARGPKMRERSMERARAMQAEQVAYIRATASTASPAEEIAKAKGLLDAGAISPAEFDTLKSRVLAG
ncbi:SHOCT domain-containing protein [Microbacterium sp. W1N]|uniref:SHOCT domain-containing protein n=1 Tax=Microbacterium festucae TaxID=2977531 RepID=UPI0021BE8C46|nr:SHOCT domain-containing protein [Microbacterium festucae]MCT9821084.1 SHOCT domain-containing protein [Microbacterium festucae]